MKKITTIKILMLAVFLAAVFQVKAQWEYMTPMPTARGFATSCVIDNKVYVIGGVFSDTSPATAVVEVYDPETNTWDTSMPDLPVALSAAAAVEMGGKIYVIGGEGSFLGTKSAAVFEYDPNDGGDWVQKNNLPAARSWHAATVADNTIYVMGGTAGSLPDNVLLKYDQVNDDWIPVQNMQNPRAFLTSEAVNDKIYAMGGMYLGVASAAVEAYDVQSGWSGKASMPGPRFWFGSGVVEDHIYVFGGSNQTGALTDTWRYDPATNDWTNIGAELPEPVSGLSHATAKDADGNECLYTFGGGYSLSSVTDAVLKFCPKKSDWDYQEALTTGRALSTASVLDGKIYVIGGLPHPETPVSEVNVYNPATDSWEANAPNLPVQLSGISSCAANGKIYVTGGQPNYLVPGGALASVYEFDPAGGTWTQKANMQKPRFYHASAMVGGKIYVMGGRSADYPAPLEKTVEMYDPVLDEWTFVEDMHVARGVFSAEVFEGKIYVMGGVETPVIHLQSAEVYDPQTNTWTELEDMPQTRVLHGSAVVNDKILVFGGVSGSEPTWPGTWEFDLQSGTWSEIEGADIPEEIIWFADEVVEFSPYTTCVYTFGGGYESFFYYPTLPAPFVTDAVFKYCVTVVSTEDVGNAPAPVTLSQNYPNPFHTSTTIQYELKNAAGVSIKIFDLTGQQVATAFDGFQSAGEHQIEWNAEGTPAGVYFYTLRTGEFVGTGKLVIQN